MSEPLRQHPFLGREREIEDLRGALERALAGRVSLHLLAGEAGIGKTRTASELAEIAREMGFVVLWARALEGDMEPAYWMWAQLLTALVESRGAACVAEWAAPHTGELARLLPELRDEDARPPASSDDDPARTRMRFFDAVSRLISRAGSKVPLLVVADDLHWADPPSLLLLEYVASHVTESRVVMLGTYRDTFLAHDGALAQCLGRLARVGQRLPLGGLPAGVIGDYVRGFSGLEPDPGWVRRIADATGGNPFFVSELVRLLSAEGRLGAMDPDAGLPLPREVRHAVGRRLESLSDPCRQALQMASVLGAEPDLALACALSGSSRSELLELVEEAIREGIVAPWGRSLTSFRFAHGLVGEVLYDGLPASERALLHRQAGEFLEQQARGPGDLKAEELARHFFEAARLGDAAPAVHYARLAGERAVSGLAYEQAVVHFEHALEAAGRGEPDDAQRARILLSLGDARWRTGADPESARKACLAAAEAAEAAGEPETLAEAAFQLGSVSAETGLVDEALVSLLERALDALGDEATPMRVKVGTRLATALYFTRAAERRDRLADEATVLARELGDPEALAVSLIAKHFTRWGPDSRPEEQLAVADEVIAAARAAGARDLELEGRAWRVFDLLEQADLDGLGAELEVYGRRGHETRTPRFLWHTTLVRACLAILRGRLDEAERLAGEARERGILPEPANALQFFGIQLFEIRRCQGRSQELAPVFEQFADHYGESMPVWRCARALLRSESGQLDAARAEVEALAVLGFDRLPRDANWLAAVTSLAQVCRRAGCADAARTLHAMLAPQQGRMVVVATSAVCLGVADHFLGLLAAAAGRLDDAVAHLEEALAFHARLGAPILLARTQLELALALEERGAVADAGRVEALRAEARQSLEDLGVPVPEAAGAGRPQPRSSRAAQPSAASPAAGAAPVHSGVLRREGEYWTIGFDGSDIRLKHRKGLVHLAELLNHPGREFHALDLVRRVEGEPADAGASREAVRGTAEVVGDSDAGETLDARARADYEARIAELLPELEEAEERGDARAGAMRAEVEALTAELAGAYGLGGRARRSGSVAERARVNVTRAVRGVLKKLADDHPDLGRYLDTTISTGLFCSFEPDPRFPVDWQVEA